MKAIKMNIEILNGKEQLKEKGSSFKLAQTKPGTVEIAVDHHESSGNALKTYKRALLVLLVGQ